MLSYSFSRINGRILRLEQQSLISTAVFLFLIVLEHTEIILVARRKQVVFFECFFNRTTWLVSMGAIVVLTFAQQGKHFGKIMAHLSFIHIEQSKPLKTRSIDDIASIVELEHLGKRSGMFSFVVAF